MSSANFLEKLLDGETVEWLPLGKITNVLRGKRLTKSQLADTGKFPVFHGGLEPLGHYTDSNRAANTVMIINVGASAGTVGYSAVDFWSSDGCFCIDHNEKVNSRFLYFALIGHQNLLRSRVRVAGIPTLDAIVVEKLEIPIPCPKNPKKSLEIQAEIVRILDAFTELAAELAAELTARKKQYNHYRDQLLSFEDGDVEWKTLGDLCSIGVGQAPVGNEIGEYAFVNAGTTPSGYVAVYNTEPNTITTPSRGQGGIGYVGYQTTRFWCGPLCYRIRSTSEMLSTRFLYHVMANSMKDIVGLANMTGVPALNKKELVGFLVPIPPPAEQERIVAILDKFDALTTSLTEGLPREIELRQKQYAYYRDLLLNFPKPEPEVAV